MARLGLRAIRKAHVEGIVTDSNGNQIHKMATEPVVTTPPTLIIKEISETGSQIAAPVLKPEPNLSQSEAIVEPETDNKVATNRQQSGNKVGTQPATNRQQSGNNEFLETSHKPETGNKVVTQPATLSATKWQQTDNKVATKQAFSSLVGLQRAIVIFLYEACKSARDRMTDKLTLEHVATCLQTHAGSVKTTIQRLESKGFIVRSTFKNGRGGWSKYELPESLFRELLQTETGNKLATNWQQTDNKVGTQPATQPATSLPCSSSILNNMNTTTTEPPEFLKVATRLENEIIFDPNLWHGLNFSKIVKYVFQAGQWVHSVTDLQEMLDGITAVIESKKSTQWPIDNPLRFLHACLTKWHVDMPSGYKSRREREAETKKASFEKERDQFLQDNNLLGHREIQTKIETVYAQKHSDRNKPGWGMNLKILQREFLNELYVRTRGYTEDVLALLGGQGMKKQLGIEETAQSLGLDKFIQPRIPN